MDMDDHLISLEPGTKVSFSKTITTKAIEDFAELTGDFSPNHMNEEFMKNSKYGRRIAHGALLVGYMSTASSMMVEQNASKVSDYTPVSLGYDRIRFIQPVFIGDEIKITYVVQKYEVRRRRSLSEIKIINQDDDLVAIATHILKWVPND